MAWQCTAWLIYIVAVAVAAVAAVAAVVVVIIIIIVDRKLRVYYTQSVSFVLDSAFACIRYEKRLFLLDERVPCVM